MNHKDCYNPTYSLCEDQDCSKQFKSTLINLVQEPIKVILQITKNA
jgi:hypothetical protein